MQRMTQKICRSAQSIDAGGAVPAAFVAERELVCELNALRATDLERLQRYLVELEAEVRQQARRAGLAEAGLRLSRQAFCRCRRAAVQLLSLPAGAIGAEQIGALVARTLRGSSPVVAGKLLAGTVDLLALRVIASVAPGDTVAQA